jgi:hypothetical protein
MSWPSSSPRCRYGSTGMAAEIRYFIASGADAVIRVESDSDGLRFSDALRLTCTANPVTGAGLNLPNLTPPNLRAFSDIYSRRQTDKYTSNFNLYRNQKDK